MQQDWPKKKAQIEAQKENPQVEYDIKNVLKYNT